MVRLPGLGRNNPVMRLPVWDFDGTLGYRVGRWSSALHSVLKEAMPGHHYAREILGEHLRRGFPWHSPEVPHPQLSSPDLWWDALSPVFVRAFEAGGITPVTSRTLASKVREAYVDPRQWRLFDDAIPTLHELSSLGWTHVILSNHAPELPETLQSLGLDEYFLRVFNSAESGHEKPHPRPSTAYWKWSPAPRPRGWWATTRRRTCGARKRWACPRSSSAARNAARDSNAKISPE